MKRKSVILTGGGTAGHITPLLAVAKELIDSYPDVSIVYVGQKGDKNDTVIVNSNIPINVYRIRAGKYRRYPTHTIVQRTFSFKRHLLNTRDLFYTFVGFIQSLYLLLKVKPEVVFIKGGYVGVPVGFAAGFLRTRIVTHDSDVVPGLANRLVSRFATYHAVATDAEYPYPKDKTFVTGIPVRDEYYEYSDTKGKSRARKELGFEQDDLILFIGGSTQGAKDIDDVIEQVVPKLLGKFTKLKIIHVFGRLNEKSIKDRYLHLDDKLRGRVFIHSFLHDNYRYMAAADVLIGRAGATFIAEASVLSSSCIIIPASHLAGSHQVENARVLKKNNSAVVLYEADINIKNVMDAIDRLLSSSDARKVIGSNLNKSERTDSAKSIVDLMMGS